MKHTKIIIACCFSMISLPSMRAFSAETGKGEVFAYEKLCNRKITDNEEQKFKKNYILDKSLIRNRYLCYGVNNQPQWEITKKQKNKYKVRVVVIGESTNKDYMSAYGYTEDTTPFLNKSNGLFFKNFISSSANTVQSLTRGLLAINKKEAQEKHQPTWDSPNSFVTLANTIGYTTYFISNQDIYGPWDAANTNIALKSNYYTNEAQITYEDGTNFTHFVKNRNKQEHTGKRNDLKMLYRFKDVLDDDTKGKEKMIFLHTWGPHFEAQFDKNGKIKEIYSSCPIMKEYDEKLPDFDIGYGPNFNCYLQGIYTTDNFIKKVYNELKSRDIDFSIMYFSDHGHDVDIDNESQELNHKTIHHSEHTKGGYNIPLVVINSDDTKKTFKEEPLSQFNLIDIYANWLGVETNLTNKRYTLNNYPDETIKTWNWMWDERDYNSLGILPILDSKSLSQ